MCLHLHTLNPPPTTIFRNRGNKKEADKRQKQHSHHGARDVGDKFREGARTFKEVGKGAWEKGGDWVFGERAWDSKGKGYGSSGYDDDSWAAYGYGPAQYGGLQDEDAYAPYGADWADGYDDKKWEGDYY